MQAPARACGGATAARPIARCERVATMQLVQICAAPRRDQVILQRDDRGIGGRCQLFKGHGSGSPERARKSGGGASIVDSRYQESGHLVARNCRGRDNAHERAAPAGPAFLHGAEVPKEEFGSDLFGPDEQVSNPSDHDDLAWPEPIRGRVPRKCNPWGLHRRPFAESLAW